MRNAVKLVVAGIVAGAALGGTRASAADLAVKAVPAPTTPLSWSGFYIGANGGYGWGGENIGYAPNDPGAAFLFTGAPFGPTPPIATQLSSSGGLGGFQIGYNWELDRHWLAGLETDFDWSGIKGASANPATANGGTIQYTTTASETVDWFGTVRARLGYLPTPNLLTYVTGGLAYGKVGGSGNYTNTSTAIGYGHTTGVFSWNCNPGAVCFTGSSSAVVPGWTVGAGLEYALSSNVTIRTDYLYVNLTGKSFAATATNFNILTTPSSYSANPANGVINVVRAAVNYRF